MLILKTKGASNGIGDFHSNSSACYPCSGILGGLDEALDFESLTVGSLLCVQGGCQPWVLALMRDVRFPHEIDLLSSRGKQLAILCIKVTKQANVQSEKVQQA